MNATEKGRQITFGSLFAGIGGFDLGFERAGMVCKWQVEIDEYARKVLAKHWPDVRRHDDVRTFPPGSGEEWKVDVICGGFPCQDISYAGLGAGIYGERSGLFFEAVRVVRQLRPRIVVLENVAALLTRGLDVVLGTLACVGYDAEWDCIPAAALGAPHSRNRVWITAYPTGKRLERRREPIATRQIQRVIAGRAFRSGPSWSDAPCIPGVGYGLPDWVDRIRGLGNAVCPPVAEFIGRRVMELLGAESK